MKAYNEKDVQAIADAIREKNGQDTKYTVGEMAQAVRDISGGMTWADIAVHNFKGDLVLDYFYTPGETITEHKVEHIQARAFEGSGSESAFKEITSVRAPFVYSIGDYAFGSCTSLKSVDFPELEYAGDTNNIFRGCSALTDVKLPKLEGAGPGMFEYCTALEKISLPELTKMGNGCFRDCTSLKEISMEKLTTIFNGSEFRGCSALETVTFPAASYIGNQSFAGCSALSLARFGAAGTIAGYAFSNCTSLKTLVLEKDAVCTLQNVNAFAHTPMRGEGGETGVIWVPAAQVEAYKTATNWATIYAEGHLEFKAIEGSKFE